ncbi:MAG: terminase large subunit domain-containing protein, partial [Ilumatobacteraceae bacterium]
AGGEVVVEAVVGVTTATMRWEEYATGSRVEHFAYWCAEFLTQSIDQFAGEPLVLEDWQLEFMGEALATDDNDGVSPWFSSCCLLVPRKSGKTTMLAAYALYRLFNDQTQPEILLAAASDKQAGRLFDTCVQFIRRSPVLSGDVALREYIGEISRADGGGKILRMASSADNLHGYSPSLVICDELHAWSKPSQRKAWAALTTAGGARKNTQVFTITTAGDANERAESILGRLVDMAEATSEVEKSPGLTISRNHESRTLVYNYSAPTKDPSDVFSMKLANPASWITEEYLARQAANPELTAEEVLQFHGCVWVAGSQAWITADAWNACLDRDATIPLGARVTLGVDVGIVHDATAVVMAHMLEDRRIIVEARIWTPRPGESVDLSVIEDYIRSVNADYQLAGVFYDPRFFERSAQVLDADGVPVVTMPQNSATMADAYQNWYAMLGEQTVIHNGSNDEFTAHCLSASAQMTDRGWKVSKIRQRQRIDALVAAVMASYGCVVQSEQVVVPGFFSV